MDKRYEEALERAKMILRNLPEGSSSARDIETIFPELQESEDERIRKNICRIVEEHMRHCAEAGIEIGDHREALQYLEKQKEQKPIPALDRGDEIILKAICEELKDAPGWVERIKGWYSLAKDAQQPAEWSGEDEKNLVSILWHVSYSVSNGKQTDCHCDLTDWLKALPERIKSIRPQPQWKPTEEQMAILDKVYHYLWADRNATADMQDGLGDLIEDLKKL